MCDKSKWILFKLYRTYCLKMRKDRENCYVEHSRVVYLNCIPFSCYSLRKLLHDNFLIYKHRFLDVIEQQCVESAPATSLYPLLTPLPPNTCLHDGTEYNCRSPWLRFRRRRSAVSRLKGLRVRILPAALMYLSREC